MPKRQGTQLVEQVLDDAVTEAFDTIARAITSGDATFEQASDVMRHWGLGEAWEEYIR